MSTPNNDQFPQYPGNGAGDPGQFQNQYAGVPANEIVEQPKHSGLAIAALVLGILALLAGWVPILGWILIIVGLVLSIVALVSAKKKGNKKGMAIAGLVLSIIAAIFTIAVTLFFAKLGMDVNEKCGSDPNAPGYEQCIQDYQSDLVN